MVETTDIQLIVCTSASLRLRGKTVSALRESRLCVTVASSGRRTLPLGGSAMDPNRIHGSRGDAEDDLITDESSARQQSSSAGAATINVKRARKVSSPGYATEADASAPFVLGMFQ